MKRYSNIPLSRVLNSLRRDSLKATEYKKKYRKIQMKLFIDFSLKMFQFNKVLTLTIFIFQVVSCNDKALKNKD